MRDLVKRKECVGFEVVTTEATKLPLLLDLTRCNFLDYQGFAGTCYLHFTVFITVCTLHLNVQSLTVNCTIATAICTLCLNSSPWYRKTFTRGGGTQRKAALT